MNGLKFWNAFRFGFPSFLLSHAYVDIFQKDNNSTLPTNFYDKCDGFNSLSSTFLTTVTIYLHHPHIVFCLSVI